MIRDLFHTSRPLDENMQRRLLNVLLLGFGGATIVLLLMALCLVFGRTGLLVSPARFFVCGLGLLAGMVVILLINNYKSSSAASLLFVIVLTITISITDVPLETVKGRSLIALSVPIAAASVLLHPAASFILAGLDSVFIVVVALSYGKVPHVFAIIVFFTIALAPWLSARGLRNSLAALRIELTERKRAEEALRESRDAIRELYRKLEAAVDEERARISRELHDDVIQRLMLGIAFGLDPGEIGPENVKTITRNVQEVNDLIRRIIRNLGMPELDNQTLVEAVRALPLLLNDARLKVSDDFGGVGAILAASAKTHVYHIIKEAVVNAIKHSEASAISVALELEDRFLHARVVDDGCGFVVEEAAHKRANFGIRGMFERAAILGADLQIESSSRGTTVSVTVPLAEF
jgi:signal transduction histidine kinase